MIQTFQFRTEIADKSYHHTVYSADVKTAVEKWLRQIEDLQNQVYWFDSSLVQDIMQKYSNGQLEIHVDKEPFFLTLEMDGKHHVVNIDKVNKNKPDFIAKVTYLTTEQGGRKGYAFSGYRPHVKFAGKKELTSGEQLFIDKEKVFPGDTVTAEIRIISTEPFKNYLFNGQHFEVAEGSRLVGHGEIVEVINPYLLASR